MGLPKPILIKRINVELSKCSDYLKADIPALSENTEFPVDINIRMVNIPGYRLRDGETEHINDHEFVITLSEEYGHRRPEIRWRSPIFHPNIMMPEDGGYVCLRTSDVWEFGSSLLSFIKSVEQLVMSPNPKNPSGTESCLKASEYFIGNASKFEVVVKTMVK